MQLYTHTHTHTHTGIFTKIKNLESKYKNIFLWVIIICILCLSVGQSSLWIDEGIRTNAAMQENLSDTIQRGFQERQILQILFFRYWNKIVGNNEFLMRSCNIIFAIIALIYLNKILNKKGLSSKFLFILLLQPLFIYYMNDIGPYIMLLAVSMAFIYYTFFDENFGKRNNLIKINAVFLLGIAIHFIFAFTYMMYVTRVLINDRKNIKNHLKIFLIFIPFYLALGIIYMKYMKSGAERGWTIPGLKNIAYIIYCFLGYQGIALSRNDLRAGNFNKFGVLSIIVSIIITLAYFIIFFNKKNIKTIVKNKIFLIGTLAYAIIFFLFSCLFKFQFWERHWITLFAVYVILLIEILSNINKIESQKLKLINNIVAGVLLIILFISSINIRFNYYYCKDDYKGVINYLKENASNEDIILIQGDHTVYKYYKIEPNEKIILINDAKNEEEVQEYIKNYNGKKLYIVLSEKVCNKDYYTKIDNSINNFNTFKVLEIN